MGRRADALTLTRFRQVCAQTPYIKKGLFYSEVFLFLQTCDRRRVDLLVESGVAGGMSTQLLAASGQTVLAIDRNFAIDPPPGVTFIRGDARKQIPQLLEQFADRRIGILLDGPKGDAALALKDQALADPAVFVVAVHDLPANHGDRHSHDAMFRARVGRELDALLGAHPYAQKYPDGPGLAVWSR